MQTDEQKFLDLDLVAEKIIHDGDRDMFREAVKCYQIGSHRAAVILVWMTTAECLKRRIQEMSASGDGQAHQAWEDLKTFEGKSTYEGKLIEQSKKCELIDDYESKSLTFARDTRSKCAHPTGISPSAETVRHIFYICSQYVLCRKGFRGTLFIKSIVSSQFADSNFLPYRDREEFEQRTKDNCNEIINQVPKRLWPLFISSAVEIKPNASPEVWRNNALFFFRVLLSGCEDNGLAQEIAQKMEGFEQQAPDFFSVLVGLDPRIDRFWNKQKRDQARARLVQSMAVATIRREELESWARICEIDGFVDDDQNLMTSKITSMARLFPDTFWLARGVDLYRLLADMSEADEVTERVGSVLRFLAISSLGYRTTPESERIIIQAITRFKVFRSYKDALESANTWKDGLLVQFVSLADRFIVECDEDNYEDITILFEAVRELLQRNRMLLPDSFEPTLEKVLNGRIQPEWQEPDSLVGELFKNQLDLLMTRYADLFSQLIKDLLGVYRSEVEANEEVEEGADE